MDDDPVKRIAFGSREQARSFADSTGGGWSVVGDDDDDWLDYVGAEGGPTEYRPRPQPEQSRAS